jgi:hypothetical protein
LHELPNSHLGSFAHLLGEDFGVIVRNKFAFDKKTVIIGLISLYDLTLPKEGRILKYDYWVHVRDLSFKYEKEKERPVGRSVNCS